MKVNPRLPKVLRGDSKFLSAYAIRVKRLSAFWRAYKGNMLKTAARLFGELDEFDHEALDHFDVDLAALLGSEQKDGFAKLGRAPKVRMEKYRSKRQGAHATALFHALVAEATSSNRPDLLVLVKWTRLRGLQEACCVGDQIILDARDPSVSEVSLDG